MTDGRDPREVDIVPCGKAGGRRSAPEVTLLCVCAVGAAMIAACGAEKPAAEPSCAAVGGHYLAVATDVGTLSVIVEQQGCAVTATIDGFGQLSCTATTVGTLPRVDNCTLELDECTASPNYVPAVTDDGSRLLFEVTTRWSTCHGNSNGGTLVFDLSLTPQS